ncbi:MAG TPA: FMN-binding negative transcriptional regulator [Steroidobacteraceae bacterium]|nr:FMN-binding negative transcriptional regulator [Steroidobacteraceae bacterium]
MDIPSYFAEGRPAVLHELIRAQPLAALVHAGPSGLDANHIAQTMKAIVGFEIAVERLTGQWKLSQNRNAADRAGAVAGLGLETDEAARTIAGRMREFGPKG